MGFRVQLQGTPVLVVADLNTVLRMDPDRVLVSDLVSRQQCWCESLLAVRAAAPPDLAAAVGARLQQLQEELTAHNAQVRAFELGEGLELDMEASGASVLVPKHQQSSRRGRLEGCVLFVSECVGARHTCVLCLRTPPPSLHVRHPCFRAHPLRWVVLKRTCAGLV